MGGIFFMKKWLFLLISVFSGYLYVSWLPIPQSVDFHTIILELVFNPVMLFAAVIVFIIGFITNGLFIRTTIGNLKIRRKRKESSLPEIVHIFLFIIICFFQMSLGYVQMTLFFIFAIGYGMMTSDKG
jgi:hypothetical protein